MQNLKIEFDDDMQDLLGNITGVCEATSFEMLYLWDKWRTRLNWNERGRGRLVCVGTIKDNTDTEHQIWLSLSKATVGDKPILFIEITSPCGDWNQVYNWLKANLPDTAFRNKEEGYLNKSDGANFHLLVNY